MQETDMSCVKRKWIYIPQAINRVRGMIPEIVSEYLEQYAYDEHIKLYTRYVLKKMGVKANRDYYDDCISNTHYGYIYSICMCAQHGYTGTHVSNYIKRMIRVKEYCRDRYEGAQNKRYGMRASSNRYTGLKKYGIGAAFRPDVAGWFNADPGSSRSSCALSVAISEFDCQGLEIDMPIIGWRADLKWTGSKWQPNEVEGSDEYDYRINSYRVLLTRGRDGFILFIPPEMDDIASVFNRAGVREL